MSALDRIPHQDLARSEPATAAELSLLFVDTQHTWQLQARGSARRGPTGWDHRRPECQSDPHILRRPKNPPPAEMTQDVAASSAIGVAHWLPLHSQQAPPLPHHHQRKSRWGLSKGTRNRYPLPPTHPSASMNQSHPGESRPGWSVSTGSASATPAVPPRSSPLPRLQHRVQAAVPQALVAAEGLIPRQRPRDFLAPTPPRASRPPAPPSALAACEHVP